MTALTSTTGRTPRFEHELRKVVLRVRSALANILEAAGGYGPHVRDVCDALNVHRKLGWQIAKVTCETDPFTAARFIPARGGMKTFLKAAARRNVEDRLLQGAAEAFADFERVVAVHADDRSSLEMMLAACSPNVDEAGQLAARKAAFAGNSAIFGAQARAYLVAAFVNPSAKPGWFDAARLHSLVGFRRNRPNLPWVISRTLVADNDYQQRAPERRERLAPTPAGVESPTVPLLPQFCSQPLPQLRRRVDAYGWMVEELVEAPVGNTAAVTLVTGELTRETAPTYKTEHTQFMDWGVWVTTPCEVLVFDQFIHKDLFPASPREVRMYANLTDPAHFAEGQVLPTFERVETPGRGLEAVHTPSIPHYRDMAKYLFERLGWDAREFELHRLRMQFPPLPAAVVVRHALRETPDRLGRTAKAPRTRRSAPTGRRRSKLRSE
jgi:hypothetical protein